jgi:hypothetical protein
MGGSAKWPHFIPKTAFVKVSLDALVGCLEIQNSPLPLAFGGATAYDHCDCSIRRGIQQAVAALDLDRCPEDVPGHREPIVLYSHKFLTPKGRING